MEVKQVADDSLVEGEVVAEEPGPVMEVPWLGRNQPQSTLLWGVRAHKMPRKMMRWRFTPLMIGDVMGAWPLRLDRKALETEEYEVTSRSR